MRMVTKRRILAALSIVALLGLPQPARSYSVLTHEAIIDALWLDSIRPVLVRRFPNATDEQLIEAHSYSYGGCLIQEFGYYPFGSTFFRQRVRLLRSVDFLQAFLGSAGDLDWRGIHL